ncbi:MAG: helix-turn-helix domain-containing protein [Planctomycetota bacterium]
MPDGELLDYTEAMRFLGISDNELQALVANGDLRAFLSAGQMKFRRDDVVSIKAGKSSAPTSSIPADSEGQSAGDLSPAVPPASQAIILWPKRQAASDFYPTVTRVNPPRPDHTVLDDTELVSTLSQSRPVSGLRPTVTEMEMAESPPCPAPPPARTSPEESSIRGTVTEMVESALSVPDDTVLDDTESQPTGQSDVRAKSVTTLAADGELMVVVARIANELRQNHVLCVDGSEQLHRYFAGHPDTVRFASVAAAQVVVDAREGFELSGRFQAARFYSHVRERLAKAFGLNLPDTMRHLEDIFQILKDENPAVICVLYLDWLPGTILEQVRGFTQDRHRALFVCQKDIPGGLAADPDWRGAAPGPVEILKCRLRVPFG